MKRILIDSLFGQRRTALVEDGQLVELFFDGKNKSIAGNIYLGRVESVIQGLKACFVEIGERKKAYLSYEGQKPKQGQEVFVQVVKDAIGTKGPFVTTNLSFAGKFLVLLLEEGEIGISKKITEQTVRQQLRDMAKEILPDGYGLIIRTDGQNKTKQEFSQELQMLLERAQQVMQFGRFQKAPCILHQENGSTERIIRELYTSDVDEIITNSEKEMQSLCSFMDFYGQDKGKVVFYENFVPLFEQYFIESQVQKAFQKRVWLKSGGYLVIEQTEALVVIDVNTGKFSGRKDRQKTFLKTNLEAAKEIARQLRIRNLSGIIIIDFIDLELEENKQVLLHALEEEVKKDRIKTTVVGMTQLGLVQVTRKKIRPSILAESTMNCPICGGSGFIFNQENIVQKMRKETIRIFEQTVFTEVSITASKRLLAAFAGENGQFQKETEKKYNKTISLLESDFAQGQYRLEWTAEKS